VHDPDLLIAKAGSCGLPYLSLRARIVDEAGNDCAAEQAGELWLKGPSITPGYWNKPQLTADAFDDGWFKTGDAAKRDRDGFYYLIDRKKDMYISGGENVYPAEVEAALAEREEIAEVAIIGVPHEQWGEVGVAYIVLAAGRTLSAEEVIAHCRQRLARFKAPAAVRFVDHIPRTSSGKMQKNLLKERVRRDL
jgi:fatty-acyl-CoA synthase